MIKGYRTKSNRTNAFNKILCTVLLISTLGIQSVFAQDDNALSLSARIGFDGSCKRDAWLPIHVDVQNAGTDLQGRIEASYENGSGGTTIAGVEIDLPATSHKEFFLYIYFTGNVQTVNIRLLDRKRVLKQVSQYANCIGAEGMLIGVVADKPSSFNVLSDIQPLTGYVRVAQLGISDLPDRSQAWNSLDALVISNVDTGTLTAKQKQSLQSWVAGGGNLLVTSGNNWQGTTSGLKDLMPVQVTTTRNVTSLSRLQAYARSHEPLNSGALLASGTLQKNARVLVYQDQIPLLVQRPLGLGAVYFLAANPTLQPLSDWSGMKDVYEHLFAARIEPLPWADGIQAGYEVNRALAAIPELGLPPGLYIWCLLIFYILVIGPLNYIVLRRMKRRELGWVTIPLLVIFFTSLSYGTGFFYRGVTPTLNRLVVVQAWDGAEEADVNALVGIYSPTRTKYNLAADQAFMFEPFSGAGITLQSNNEWRTLQQGQVMIMSDLRGEIGDMKSVAVKGNIPALEFQHDLVLTLSKTDPSLTGTITNTGPYTIRDAILVTPDSWRELDDFAPGETRNINLTLGTSTSGPSLFDISTPTILNYSNPGVDTDVDVTRRDAFLNAVLYSNSMTNRGNWGIFLLGWVDDIKLPVQLQDKRSKNIDTVLYIDRLSPTIKTTPGIIRLPSSMFAWESSSETASPYYTSNIPSGGYILRFRPGIPLSYREVNSLDIHLSSTVGTQDIMLSAWDYDQKTWVRFDLVGTLVHLNDAEQYVGPDGEVRIQIKYTGTNWAEIQYSYITLVVR